MSGGGDDDANRLLDEQIRQAKEEKEQRLLAIKKERMSVIQGQGAQQFTNPDNPNPPMQVIQ